MHPAGPGPVRVVGNLAPNRLDPMHCILAPRISPVHMRRRAGETTRNPSSGPAAAAGTTLGAGAYRPGCMGQRVVAARAREGSWRKGREMHADDAHPSSPELLIGNPHLVAVSTLAGGGACGAAGFAGLTWQGSVLVVGDEVLHGHNVIAVRAGSARAEAPAPGVAVLAALGAEVPGLALRAFVDGVDLGGLGGSGCCPAAAPGSLPAGVGAPLAAARGCETRSALCADGRCCRLGIVTHADHRDVPGSGRCWCVWRGGCCRSGRGGPVVGRNRRRCR